jgi:hypothetical protein
VPGAVLFDLEPGVLGARRTFQPGQPREQYARAKTAKDNYTKVEHHIV